MLGYFYRITLPKTGYFYLGSTRNIKKRADDHLSALSNNSHHNKFLQEKWNTGCETVLNLCIFRCGTISEAQEKENEAITENLNNPLMTNIGLQAVGGDNLSRNPERDKIISKMKFGLRRRYSEMTLEQRKALSARVAGKNNPMYGRKHTDEARRRISEMHKGLTYNRGRKLSTEHVAKISARAKLYVGVKNPFYGKKHSEEYKKQSSMRQKGVMPTNANKVEIDGIVFSSQAEAGRALGVCHSTITNRILSKDPKFFNYRVIKNE